MRFDFELSNRCNATCSFCPRDKTPHQGLMSEETFEQALRRAVELRALSDERLGDAEVPGVSLCGLGEPLLNKHAADFVRRVRAEGFLCSISSNGALLTEERGRALLDAGLNRIDLNVSEIGEEYEAVYGLRWEKTRDRVLRFKEMAGDACEVQLIVVPHRGDQDHVREVTSYWQKQGLDKFFSFTLTNRGGALAEGGTPYTEPGELREAARQLASVAPRAFCLVPFYSLFVGYDGQYYLCCSDWTKLTPYGSVFDRSFMDVVGPKLDHVLGRGPVCASCNFDPLNRLIDLNRGIERGEVLESEREALFGQLRHVEKAAQEHFVSLGHGATYEQAVEAAGSRRARLALPILHDDAVPVPVD